MEEKKGRGRPRPVSTLERDEEVFKMLNDAPRSRQQLADYLGVNLNIVYMSLIRLRRAGRVTRVRNGKYHLWMQTTHA